MTVVSNCRCSSRTLLVPSTCRIFSRFGLTDLTMVLANSAGMLTTEEDITWSSLTFSVRLFAVDDFAVGLNEEGEVRAVTAATPEYRYVDLRDADTDFLLNVRVDSRDGGVCAIVSVQPPGCPVSDTEDVVRKK